MKSNRIQLALLCLACLGWTAWASSQDFDKTQIQPVKVADGVYLLLGTGGPIGGNIGVSVGGDGVLLIDSQFGELHDRIKTALATIGIGTVRVVLNTNGHYDHALGNELFAKDGAVIIAHENARKRMMTKQVHDIIDSKTLPYPTVALPVVTFTESLTLHVNGEDIQAIHVPNAHSDSDAFYWLRKANVIHTGDLFFSGGYPYIDIGNGGTIKGMIAAADKILGISDEKTKLIPGHGSLSDRRRLAEYRAMLVTSKDRMVKMVKEGMSLEAVVASKPTADLDKYWTAGIGMPADMFVAMVYKDLSR